MRTVVNERLRRLSAAAQASDELAQADREARDDAIEQAELEGLSVRQIAQAMEGRLSVSRVQAIVLERTAARQERIRQAAGL